MPISLKKIMPNIHKTIDYDYKTIKSDAYEDVIAKILGDVKKAESPVFEQIMGIPGSGKGLLAKKIKRADNVLIDFNHIMEAISQYQKDNKKYGGVKSFAKWEMPARVIGYEALRRAVQKNLNIIFNNSGLYESGVELLKSLKDLGYSTQIFCLKCDVKEAYKRTEAREKITKRHTPKQLINQRARIFEIYVEEYKKIADKITVYDTSTRYIKIISSHHNTKWSSTYLANTKNIVISSNFGHEIMACIFAMNYNSTILIRPNSAKKEEYNKEAERILGVMKFFYHDIKIVPFEKRKQVKGRDIAAELKSGIVDDSEWIKMAGLRLTPTVESIKDLPRFKPKDATLFVPAKLISDELLGKSAEQQSLNPSVFDFLKEKNLILGQHFHKVNDLSNVKKIAKEFDAYIPGLTENKELLGLRGVSHEQYFHMYNSVSAAVGIAGTHTWILLTMFPETPQIVLYRKGVENWDVIAESYQSFGFPIYAIGFDDNTNMKKLSKKIKREWIKNINKKML